MILLFLISLPYSQGRGFIPMIPWEWEYTYSEILRTQDLLLGMLMCQSYKRATAERQSTNMAVWGMLSGKLVKFYFEF